jgi:hypothetical protein
VHWCHVWHSVSMTPHAPCMRCHWPAHALCMRNEKTCIIQNKKSNFFENLNLYSKRLQSINKGPRMDVLMKKNRRS